MKPLLDSNRVETMDKIKRCNYLDKINAEINVNDIQECNFTLWCYFCVKILEPRDLIANKSGFHVN